MLWLIIAMLIIIADQAVKYLVVSGMNVGDTAFSILNLFDITYIQNKGAAFSLLSGKLSLLSIISVLRLCGNILDKEKADTSAFVYIDYNDVCGRIRQCNRQNFQRFCY